MPPSKPIPGQAPQVRHDKQFDTYVGMYNLPNGSLRNPGFGSTAAAVLHPGKDNGRLFHDQIILYGFDPFNAPCDFIRFIDGLLRINEAAQLNGALESFDADLK